MKNADGLLTVLLEAFVEMADDVFKFADGFFGEVFGFDAVFRHLANLVLGFLFFDQLVQDADGTAVLADLKQQSCFFLFAHPEFPSEPSNKAGGRYFSNVSSSRACLQISRALKLKKTADWQGESTLLDIGAEKSSGAALCINKARKKLGQIDPTLRR